MDETKEAGKIVTRYPNPDRKWWVVIAVAAMVLAVAAAMAAAYWAGSRYR